MTVDLGPVDDPATLAQEVDFRHSRPARYADGHAARRLSAPRPSGVPSGTSQQLPRNDGSIVARAVS